MALFGEVTLIARHKSLSAGGNRNLQKRLVMRVGKPEWQGGTDNGQPFLFYLIQEIFDQILGKPEDRSIQDISVLR